MPTISGLRRRGYTPTSIRNFIDKVGVAKRDNIIDVSLLEFCVREDLNKKAARIMAVLDPIKLVIQNYPEEQRERLEADNNPEEENAGTHTVPFSRTLFIEREDFMEEANSKYFRLSLGKEVRLKNAFIIKGESVVKDANGVISEIHCSYDPKSLSGSGTPESHRKVKGTLHWVSITHAIEVEVREYDRLFSHEDPDNQTENFMTFVNPESLKVRKAFIEPHITNATVGQQFQFQRIGYFNLDKDSTETNLVFNKTVGLRDTWAKQAPKQAQNQSTSKPSKQSQRKPIDVIKQLGKKYTNLPEEKQQKVKAEILLLAKAVSYDDLEPLFNTAAKKVGTRIAAVLVLKVMLENGQQKTDQIADFLETAKADANALLSGEAQHI